MEAKNSHDLQVGESGKVGDIIAVKTQRIRGADGVHSSPRTGEDLCLSSAGRQKAKSEFPFPLPFCSI